MVSGPELRKETNDGTNQCDAAVYRYLLPLPRIRFLLAEDTGVGKTIMTGLLIKELLFRGVIQKILIVTPGGLTEQWTEEELQEKFGLHARLVNRASFDAEPGQSTHHSWSSRINTLPCTGQTDSICSNAAMRKSTGAARNRQTSSPSLDRRQ